MKKFLLALAIVAIASTAQAGPVYSGAKAAGKGAVKVAKVSAHVVKAAGHYVANIAKAL